ncbi:1-deoxy-D-xylulose-5-phosphate synthase [Oceanidesulfovibrio indonesiensis]|uniref:1-deoxy-D-xylulose-5-phosphate synthase n=1 Tax=Oceanidesulfovibrio indonesiensis TaxID=54767 RepID=A0A7M3MHT5_9BACT|nr:1-deoxy-D-xylulose-5-phosphate synthase [Oceanidesulfovibrio indonesiensis]TVM18481.1 1-deoxy-D-xylulose-5-phosphate synthase [Oceanidesulfovibrio indonesiensis]
MPPDNLPAAINFRDLPQMSLEEMGNLAGGLRREIIEVVSRNGGHLAPSLGVVELTVAMLNVFDPGKDRIVWDVGHQAYAYKILTSRRSRFHTLRTMGGVSGFPKMSESPYDHFGVGHSSTSISAALGMAMGRDLNADSSKVLAVIGDGSMTAGLAFEGLNQAGDMGRDLIVVLNDNEMSISRNVGALSSFLSRNLSARWLKKFKRETENFFKQLPGIGTDIADYMRKSESSFKSFFTPGMLFEAFRFNYIGPIDGHDISDLVDVFDHVKRLEGPNLVHVLTRKGKGYEPAESNPTYFHGVGCFEPETGLAKKFTVDGCPEIPSYTEVFGDTLANLAGKDSSVIAITAAMPEGTGLSKFADAYPERFVDVGICEQHAVTFAAGLATQGYKPVVAIYSTFLQRSYDQIVHDVCLQKLPVIFCLDRAGLVGEDGPTHHGAYDIAYLRHIPEMVMMAPKDEAELQSMLATALELGRPVAIRYPRGLGVGAKLTDQPQPVPVGEGELIREGTDAMVIALGSRVYPALEGAAALEAEGLDVGVFNTRFVKPLPIQQILELAAKCPRLVIAEEHTRMGGFASAVLESLADADALSGLTIRRVALPDSFVEHGTQKELRAAVGVDKTGIMNAVRELCGRDVQQTVE